MASTPKNPRSKSEKSPPFLKGGEFKREADETNKRSSPAPSLSETDWADLPPKEREKRQRG
jgi:hypothetical protein